MTPEHHDTQSVDRDLTDPEVEAAGFEVGTADTGVVDADAAGDPEVSTENGSAEPASPVDDVPMQAWITIGLFVLVGIIFAAVCLPLIM